MLYEEDQDLQQSMGAFEAALHAETLVLPEVRIAGLVVAVDGSNQDDATVDLAGVIATAHGARVAVMAASDGARTAVHEAAVARALERLKAPPHDLAATAEQGEGAPAKQILAVRQRTGADLIVAPAPYGRDLGDLADESLSSVIDVLMAESEVPLLLVRQPAPDLAACLGDIVVPVGIYTEEVGLAASWAFALLRGRGELELLAVADRPAALEAAKLLGEKLDAKALTAEALERAEGSEVASLVAAIQKRGRDTGVHVHVEVKAGNPMQVIAAEVGKKRRLIAVGAPSDRTSAAYHRVQDLVLRSRNPVLVT